MPFSLSHRLVRSIRAFFRLGLFHSTESSGFEGDWGIYEDIWGVVKYSAMLRETISKIGHAPRYVLFFRDLKCPFPSEIPVSNPEINFIVSLELHEWGNLGGWFDKPGNDREEVIFMDSVGALRLRVKRIGIERD